MTMNPERPHYQEREEFQEALGDFTEEAVTKNSEKAKVLKLYLDFLLEQPANRRILRKVHQSLKGKNSV